MRTTGFAWVAAAAVLQAACSSGGGEDSAAAREARIAADTAAIMEFNRKYLEALNNEDFPLLSSLTAEDHIMLASNAPAIVGKQANDALNGPVLEKWDNSEIWTPIETGVDGGKWAWQRGTYDIIMTAKDGSGGRIRSVGKYIHIYRREPDGSWRMIRDMYSSDYPPNVTPPEREEQSPQS